MAYFDLKSICFIISETLIEEGISFFVEQVSLHIKKHRTQASLFIPKKSKLDKYDCVYKHIFVFTQTPVVPFLLLLEGFAWKTAFL